MLNTVLLILHNAITLLFGIYISAAFLGIRMNHKNFRILSGFFFFSGTVYALNFMFFGDVFAAQIYPLIIHLPLILLFTFYYKYRLVLSALSVSAAYMCCQISKWVGLAAKELTRLEWVYYSVRIVTTVVAFIILLRYVSNATSQLMKKPTRALLIFALLPFTYYLFDYTTEIYTTLLYSGKEVVIEFLGFILCIDYLLFLLVYFEQYEKKYEAEQQILMMEMHQVQSRKEIEANKRSEYAVSILRHDMRHLLASIASYMDNGEYGKAREYINSIISYTDKISMHKFCKNEIVNMILSARSTEMNESDIDFQYSIEVPEQLSVSDVDLTSILSNALENAIHAVLPLETKERHIILDMHMNNDKLLISVKNTFAEKPEITDGLPRTKRTGHGFGTQSIRYVAEKLNGNYQFSVKDDWFILRVVL